MKIRIEPTETGKPDGIRFPTIEISVDTDVLDVYEVWDLLVKPALIGWGFAEATVNDLRGDD